jgi:membrane-associated PAP2 superfamily phosphatase
MQQTPQNTSCRSQLWLATIAFLPLLVLCTVTELDLLLAACFYKPGLQHAWFIADVAPWSWLYRYGEYPALVMVAGALLVLLGSLRRQSWVRYRRRCLFLILVVALGPGLLVNGLLKPGWSRPRPRQIEQFGGLYAYRPWWRPGGPGAGRSVRLWHTHGSSTHCPGGTFCLRCDLDWGPHVHPDCCAPAGAVSRFTPVDC